MNVPKWYTNETQQINGPHLKAALQRKKPMNFGVCTSGYEPWRLKPGILSTVEQFERFGHKNWDISASGLKSDEHRGVLAVKAEREK